MRSSGTTLKKDKSENLVFTLRFIVIVGSFASSGELVNGFERGDVHLLHLVHRRVRLRREFGDDDLGPGTNQQPLPVRDKLPSIRSPLSGRLRRLQ
ncbi:hypothetical protein D3C71_1857930 [compost metagenome]